MHQQIGMENILTNVAPHLGVVGGAPLLRPTPELAARWGALDDGACARACTPPRVRWTGGPARRRKVHGGEGGH